MLLLIIRVSFLVACAGSIATYVNQTSAPEIIKEHPFLWFLGFLVLSQSFTLVDMLVKRKDITVVSAIYFGLMIGFLLSFLLKEAIEPLMTNSPFRKSTDLLITLTLPYLCISLLLQTRNDFRFLIPYVEFSRELKGGKPLILDSSALIDGRIADVIDTKILDTQMIVPQFILHEIQDIADSNDKMRRTRGRRGLEVLSKLQNNPAAEIRMMETGTENESRSVDHRLVALAKEMGGRVVTNDFNLNKVASLQGVDVVNLNDVANALKPRYLPGERLNIKVVKEGEAAGQGVGYLDDGTMVVCESANHLIGKDIDVIVTSVLQSSAGRMIFGRQVHTVNR